MAPIVPYEESVRARALAKMAEPPLSDLEAMERIVRLRDSIDAVAERFGVVPEPARPRLTLIEGGIDQNGHLDGEAAF